MKKSLLLAALLTLALAVAPVAGVVFAQDADIVDTAVAAGDFSTLVTAVDAAGLVETLKSEGPFTVFAPNDAAFAALPDGALDSLLADPSGALTDVLLYHVVPGRVMAADLTDGMEVATANGASVTISLADGAMVNDANIIATDIEASNGVIHVIDKVLMPPMMEGAEMEATPEATEEAMMEATPEATEEAMMEATPEATEEAMMEATPEATEEAMMEGEATEEAMAAEATEEAMMEATPEATEEAMMEATPEPMEGDSAEGDADMAAPAPEVLPVTGASTPSTNVPFFLIVGAALFGAAFVMRRRS